MSVDRTAGRTHTSPMVDAQHPRSGLARPMLFLACLAIGLIPTTTPALAHVKWFVKCNVSDDPIPLQSVFTPTFWLSTAVFMAVFYVICQAEQTRLGALVSRQLDRFTEPLHRRTDDLLRAATAIAFAVLWANGSLILT